MTPKPKIHFCLKISLSNNELNSPALGVENSSIKISGNADSNKSTNDV